MTWVRYPGCSFLQHLLRRVVMSVINDSRDGRRPAALPLLPVEKAASLRPFDCPHQFISIREQMSCRAAPQRHSDKPRLGLSPLERLLSPRYGHLLSCHSSQKRNPRTRLRRQMYSRKAKTCSKELTHLAEMKWKRTGVVYTREIMRESG